ncbi:hypothetical protein BDV24DRAFT_104123 [Aspergillus arachidicola]|uniref:Uncharacterized protein n=1 Tax=Aspergillus arachidicola TaxID=656916 RepID=A0A5N6XVT1_9EURO|nr:hypothetical protein BDV24DRAFT_104123 [Aspergillus arachidicola]
MQLVDTSIPKLNISTEHVYSIASIWWLFMFMPNPIPVVNFSIYNTRSDGCLRSAISDGVPTITRNIIFFCGSRRCVSRQ